WSAFLHARARQNASLVPDEAKPIHTIGEGHFIAPGNASLIEDWAGEVEWKKRLGMDFGVFVRAVCGESRTYGNEGGSRLYM
ncbi:hypothetical protein S83_070267, partial [Arachis hypogaea]